MKAKIYMIALFCVLTQFSYSQCEEVCITGRIIDTNSVVSFYNFMVINVTTQRGVFGNPDGSFEFCAAPGDRIGLSVKTYGKEFIDIPQNIYNCKIDTIIYLNKKIQEYEVVEVRPIRTLNEIKEEREALSKMETKKITGINVFESPITALYERFSKSAKQKQFLAEQKHQDNIHKILQDLLRVYVAYDVIYLNEEEFQNFIYFLNIDEHFLKTAKDYDLIIYIRDKLEHYRLLYPELFEKKE